MKFSVLIPAYKIEFLHECIESIVTQTYEDYEVIIVDDASPNDVYGIVSQFTDSRIRYYRNANNCGALHLVDNWNICLSYAKGDYVICMGDDDKLLPYCLDTYNQLIQKYPDLDVYHGLSEIIDEHSFFVDLQSPRPEMEFVFSLIWNKLNGRCSFIGDYLFRTEALRKEGGFYDLPMAWASDDITVYRAALSKGVANTLVPVFQYRRNALTLSNIGDVIMKISAVHLEKKWVETTVRNHIAHDVVDERYQYMLQRSMNCLYELKIYRLLVKDTAYGSLRSLFNWLSHYKTLGLPIKLLIRAYLVGLKVRMFHK